MMNFARGSAWKRMRMSRKDWCFDATSTSPVGTSPRTSTRSPQITRRQTSAARQ